MLRLIVGWFVQVEGKCRAGQMLAALGLDISLAGLQAATATAAKDLLLLLLRQLADTQPPVLESRYCFCPPAFSDIVWKRSYDGVKAGLKHIGFELVTFSNSPKNTEALQIIISTVQCSVWHNLTTNLGELLCGGYQSSIGCYTSSSCRLLTQLTKVGQLILQYFGCTDLGYRYSYVDV